MLDLWKKYNVKYAEFEFSCGGDSMQDELLIIYNEQDEQLSNADDLVQILETNIYKHVNFYVNSDGVYLGEYGTVTIKLNDNDEFEYIKNATSEYIEENVVSIDISNVMLPYKDILEYIIEITGNDYGNIINYSKDFILTSEIKSKIATIRNTILETFDNYELPEIQDKNVDDVHKDRFDFFTANCQLDIHYTYIITEPSE